MGVFQKDSEIYDALGVFKLVFKWFKISFFYWFL